MEMHEDMILYNLEPRCLDQGDGQGYSWLRLTAKQSYFKVVLSKEPVSGKGNQLWLPYGKKTTKFNVFKASGKERP